VYALRLIKQRTRKPMEYGYPVATSGGCADVMDVLTLAEAA
jgi:hypothetical protein